MSGSTASDGRKAPEPAPRRIDLEAVEVDLLLEAVYQAYGFDFRRYARPSIRRRLRRQMEAEGVATISGLQERVLHDRDAMRRLLLEVSVSVSAMFRDPSFYRAFRSKVVRLLDTYPFVRLWNAGCSTGEETYSLAIVLHEHGLAERARIYATDMNQAVLDRAQAGSFPIAKMREYTSNYIAAGGTRAFSEYYVADGERAHFHPWLVENVVFAEHNLVSDRSFNEFNVILCRNVMIYFDKTLQDDVHGLLHESLVRFGVLGLGRKESLRFSRYATCYEELDADEKLYRKVK